MLQILATDVDAPVVGIGHNGLHPSTIEETAPHSSRACFFLKEAGSYTSSAELLAPLEFAIYIVLVGVEYYHAAIAVCYNVLINLTVVAQERIMVVLYFALRPEGLLLVGSSESLASASNAGAVTSGTKRFTAMLANVGHAHSAPPG